MSSDPDPRALDKFTAAVDKLARRYNPQEIRVWCATHWEHAQRVGVARTAVEFSRSKGADITGEQCGCCDSVMVHSDTRYGAMCGSCGSNRTTWKARLGQRFDAAMAEASALAKRFAACPEQVDAGPQAS